MVLFLLDWEQGENRLCAEADGIVSHDGEKQDSQLSALLFSLLRQMVLNLEMLNNPLEEGIESGQVRRKGAQ